MRQMFKVSLALLVVASLCFSQPAAAASSLLTWEAIGPYDIQWVTVAPSNSQLVFALSKSYFVSSDATPQYTLFGSSDRGLHWAIVKEGLKKQVALVIDPTHANVLYLYLPDTAQSILRSGDAGQTWAPFATPADMPIGTFRINPGNPLIMYIGTYSNGQYISTDGGQIWSVTDCYVYSCEYLVFSPGNPQTIYGFGWTTSVYKSTDWGQHWVNKSSGLNSGHCRGLVINPHEPAQMFITCLDDGKVYVSNNAGDSWEETTHFFPYAFDPLNAQIVYKAENGHIYRSSDGAASWKLITGAFPQGTYTPSWEVTLPNKMVLDPADPARLWCATELGLYQSSDRGENWQLAPAGYGRGVVTSLAMSKGAGAPFYASLANVTGYSASLALLGNRSGNWTNIDLGVTNTNYFAAADPNDPAVAYLAVSNFGVYKTSNSGGDWALKDSGMTNKMLRTSDSIAFLSQYGLRGSLVQQFNIRSGRGI